MPTLLILAVMLALIGGLAGIGFVSLQRLAAQREFLPTHRIPWFVESVIAFDMTYALYGEGQDDILITGGSASLAGLVTRSFEEATGKRAYNFGTNIDIGPAGHFEYIRTYILTHQPPEAIVYIATARDVGDEQTYDAELLNRFARVYAPSMIKAEMPLASSFQQYMMEGKLALELAVRSRNRGPLDMPRGRRLSHNDLGPVLAMDRGFQEYPQYTSVYPKYLEKATQFTISEWYIDSFRDMAQESQDLGVPFLIYFAPIPVNDFDVDDGPLIAWAEQLESEFPGTDVGGLPLAQYDLELWGNEFHLNRKGAERFTSVVADSIETATAKLEGR